MKKYYLWLILVLGAGNPVTGELITRFGNAEEIYRAFKNNCAAAGSDYAKKAEKITLEDAEKLVSKLEKTGITIVTPEDPLYPENLRKTDNPPVVLFAKGNTELLKEKLLTIGGARRITEYTIAAESEICEELCKEYTLVASLATGCEQLACLSALKQRKGCIEILPCGFDYEYPKGTQMMRQQILMNGGCILSEFLPETKTSNANYIKRARISGGISKAMIVFQAAVNSGSLNAAKHSPALFFIPPENVFSEKYAAAVSGVRNGARLYLSPNSLKQAFADEYEPVKVQEFGNAKVYKKSDDTTLHGNMNVSEETNDTSSASEVTAFESEIHEKIFTYISGKNEAVTFDELYRLIDGDIADLSEILLDLEISGMIRAVAGNRFEKN